MRYNKLVRDKIPQYIKKKGGTPIFHVAKEREYWKKLKEKLNEEVKEFCESESIEEMADLVEITDAACKYKKFNKRKLLTIRKNKARERGVFKKRIILDES